MTFPISEIQLGVVCDARRQCTRTARHIVSIHNVHDCHAEGLTPTGDTVSLMCLVDMCSAAWRIGVMVGEMYAGIPDEADEDEVPVCDTCGREIRDVQDVMTVEDL